MTETTTTTVAPAKVGNGHAGNGNGAAVAEAPAVPAPQPVAKAQPAPKQAKPKVLPAQPAANPLKALEKAAGKAVNAASAKPVKGKAAAPAAKANAKEPTKSAIPAKTKFSYTRRFARVFESMLADHGYELTVSDDEGLVIAENKTAKVRVEIQNPNKQWASKTAPWKATCKGKKPSSGEGRDALAKELGVPGYGRR
jgi:hypothetical protein